MLVQSPPDAAVSWEGLRGKVVVLDFWATWCGPCLAAVPHLNRLADSFSGEPVVFLAISDEQETVVRRFIEKRPIHGWVALDAGRSTFDAYGIEGIPQAVVVDAAGIVRASLHPEQVTEALVRELLAGRIPKVEADLRASYEDLDLRARAGGDDSLFEVVVVPSPAGAALGTQTDSQSFFLHGATFEDAVRNVYGMDSTRVVFLKPAPEGRFDFRVKLLGPLEQRKAVLQQSIQAAFGLRAYREQREVEVFLLRGKPTPSGGLLRNDDGSQGFHRSAGSLDASSLSAGDLARCFESVLSQPVIDETKLLGRYDLHLDWDDAAPHGLVEKLREQVGLELVPARRQIEVLVFSGD
jgi:uncharacterized protein (TIGR03435 family)